MRTLPPAAALLTALALLAGPAAADPPPPAAELKALLDKEPLDLASWPKWSARLKEWSGEHYEAARPAFDRAFEFLKKQQATKLKRPVPPKGLDKDAVAWMVLAGAYLNDPAAAEKPVPAAKSAADLARAAVKIDNTLARAHHYLAEAIRLEQLAPTAKGGTAKADRKRVEEALKALREARALDPKGKWLTPSEAAELALKVDLLADAEAELTEALKQTPGDAELARRLARAITKQGGTFNKRTAPYAPPIQPLTGRFPKDGVLASHYALALSRDGKKAEAATQMRRARELGTDPSEVMGAQLVIQLDQDHPPPKVAVGAPPDGAGLARLLQQEPVNQLNWWKWSPRLRTWSGEHFQAARPAFDLATQWVKDRHTLNNNRPGLPKDLDNDAVAWMLLAGLYIHEKEAAPGLGPVAVARIAFEAAERSIRRDPGLARAHHYRCLALQLEQMTPHDKGGPAKVDAGRLRSAVDSLNKAKEIDPKGLWLSGRQAGSLAAAAERWEDAERYYSEALKAEKDEKIAVQVARAINNQGDRRKNPSAALGPLVEQFPNSGAVRSHHVLALVRDRKTAEAQAELARVREMKVNPSSYIPESVVRDLDQAQTYENIVSAPVTFFSTVWWWTLRFIIFYASVMVFMCLCGLLLARYTRGPKAEAMLGVGTDSIAAGGQVHRTRGESWLTRFYVALLLLALVLFYLSLPFLFVGLLIVFLLLIVAFLFASRDRDHNTAGTNVDLLKASGGGMSAVFKAMFAKVGTGGYGVLKDRRQCPKLYAMLEDVARRVDTDPVDEVWISPGADFGVHQEGRGPFGVFGGRKRVLTIGLCVMHYLSVGELKAILAHEYAHFSHADTFWNRFLFQVTLSLRTAMREMSRTGGWVTWVNPFYWFFWLYSKSYSLLSAGFSRSREYLADRMACTLYGADVFANALRKVCTDGSHFEMTVYHNIVRLLKAKKAYVNMYLAFRQHRDENLTDEERRKLHKKLLDEKASVFRSHPTFQERMEAAKLLPRAATREDVSSLSLFESSEAVEKELTDFLTEVVADVVRR